MPPRPPTYPGKINAGPSKAMIEVVRACNLLCPSCPVGNGLARQWPNMAFDMYARIIDLCGQTLEQLSLFNYGEPLLCRDIDRYVLYAKDAGIERVIIHTNGMLLSKQMGEKIIDAGLDRLTVSVDAVDADTYVKYRIGGDFTALLTNIRQFIALREQAGKTLPQVEGQFIVMSHNEHQISDFAVLCRQLGVDVVSVKTYNANMDLKQDHRHDHFEPLNRALLRQQGYPDADNEGPRLRGCSWPRNVLVVTADGTVVPCGYDYNNWDPIGSFRETSQEEWWHTRERQELVGLLERNPLSITLCRNCTIGKVSLWKSPVSN